MADKRDYYELLGVSKTATESEIKSAFRKKAKECHPDLHPGDKAKEAQFKELNEAAEILSDADKRAKYDQFGHAAFDPSMGGQDPFAGGGFGGFGDFGDILGQMFGGGFGGFGGGQTRNGPIPGDDLRFNLTITFEEAAFGVEKEITIPREESCETCHGSGAKPGTGTSTCRHCNGQGKVRAAQGFFTIERTCPICNGRGQILEQPCTDCGGQGRRQQNRTLSVDIPKGIEDGTRIRLANEGEAGLRGGPPGDLYIFISIKPHDLFQRDGADLYARVPIAMTTAALGGEFEVPTLDAARARVKVSSGTQPGQRVRLKGKGMPVLRSKDFGDLYVQLDVETPQSLSKRQRELLEEFERESTRENSPTSEGFFVKLKSLFEN